MSAQRRRLDGLRPGAAPGAGAYAQQRFTRARAYWRARMRLVFAVCFGPFIVLGVAGLVVYRHPVAWVAGVSFGMATGVWIALRDTPPPYIENWRTGAEGERKTARQLSRLDHSRWLVVDEVQHRYGNYDHILVGAPGVFLLDSKNPSGTLHIAKGEPWLRRRSDPEADGRCPQLRNGALAGAARLHRELRDRTGATTWVKAVVVLWCDFDEGIYQDELCAFVHGPLLVEWLACQHDVLDDATVKLLSGGVEDLRAEGPSTPQRPARP